MLKKLSCILLFVLLSSCTPNQNGGERQEITPPQANAAHNERVFIPFSHNNEEKLEVLLAGQAVSDYTSTADGIVLDLPSDTSQSNVDVKITQGQSSLEQHYNLLSSFSSNRLNVLVNNIPEDELRTLLANEGMKLISYQTPGDIALAEVDLLERSHKQGLAALTLQSQQLEQQGRLLAPSSDFSYKPVMYIHSLDPSCQVLPHLDHASEAWKLLYTEPEKGQASLWAALSANRAWDKGLKGKGVTIYIFDSVDKDGNDIFDCPHTPDYVDGHGSYVKKLVELLAPEANIQTRRVCDKEGMCPSKNIAKELLRLQAILETGQAVIVSLSLSAAPHPDAEIGIDNVLYQAMKQLESHYDNLLIVASAGNNGLDGDAHKNSFRLPSGLWNGLEAKDGQGQQVAALANMISVGSIGLSSGTTFDGSYTAALYNPNVPITMLAPSIRLCLAYPTGGCFPDGSSKGLSGTSFAAPIAAATAALYWQACPKLDAAGLASFMSQNPNADMKTNSPIPAISSLPYKACPQSKPSAQAPRLVRAKLDLEVGDSYDLKQLVAEKEPASFVWHTAQNNLVRIDKHNLQTLAAGTVMLELYHPATPDKRASLELTIREKTCTNPPHIPDTALKRQMEVRWGSPLTCELMAKQTRLFALGQGIKDLTGLQYAYNLEKLNISSNPLGAQGNDVLAPLSSLKKLTELEIHSAGLRSEQLAPLTAITSLGWLSLHSNALEDIESLRDANFPQMHSLWLYLNKIEDISPLATLTSLQHLPLNNNKIEDISPLQNLSQLQTLNLGDNPLASIDALGSLSQLEELHLYSNGITKLEVLSNLEQLQVLRAFNNNISDITPLSKLTRLKELSLWNNNISDIQALAAMNLSILNLDNNPVKDISVLAGMDKMNKLELANTHVSSIAAVASMPHLTFLDIGASDVKDISPLANTTNLETLDISALDLGDDASKFLANKVSLRHVQLGSNRFSNVEFLRTLPVLEVVNLFSNHLTDLSPLLANQGINKDDKLNILGNDWLLLEDKTKILEQIAQLEGRGVKVTVEAMPKLEPSKRVMLQRTLELTLNGHTPNNDNRYLANLSPVDVKDQEQWFALFPKGSYQQNDGNNNSKGTMLRRVGTTLCLSARPHKSSIASFWRCVATDPFQQWQFVRQGDQTMLKLSAPAADGRYFCLNAYQPQKKSRVNMWACDAQDSDQLWRIAELK